MAGTSPAMTWRERERECPDIGCPYCYRSSPSCALPVAAPAQDYPARSIRIIVPNPPGGAGDISARLIGRKLSEGLTVPVVVENQAGASGAIGMNMLKRAAPDGGTIGVVISLAQTIDLIQNKTASFDIVKDFTPITAIADNPAGLVVNSQITAPSLAAFIELARQQPGKISYGSAGIGTAHHLYGQVLNKTAGIELLYVPYKGVTPALNDVLGGHVPTAIVSLAAALPHIQERSAAASDRVRHQALCQAAGRPRDHRGGAGLRARARLDRPAGAARPAGRDHRAPAP